MANAKPQTERTMPMPTVDATKPMRLDAKSWDTCPIGSFSNL